MRLMIKALNFLRWLASFLVDLLYNLGGYPGLGFCTRLAKLVEKPLYVAQDTENRMKTWQRSVQATRGKFKGVSRK